MKKAILYILELFYIIKPKPRIVEFENGKFGIRTNRRIDGDFYFNFRMYELTKKYHEYYNGGLSFLKDYAKTYQECEHMLKILHTIPKKDDWVRLKVIRTIKPND
jgi:hypothetical protein